MYGQWRNILADDRAWTTGLLVMVGLGAYASVAGTPLASLAFASLLWACVSTQTGRWVTATVAALMALVADPATIIAMPGIAVLIPREGAKRYLFAAWVAAMIFVLAFWHIGFDIASLKSWWAQLRLSLDHANVFAAFGHANADMSRNIYLPALGLAASLISILAVRWKMSATVWGRLEARNFLAAFASIVLIALAPGLQLMSALYVLPVFFVVACLSARLRPSALIYAGIVAFDMYYFSSQRVDRYIPFPGTEYWSTPYLLGSFLWKLAVLVLMSWQAFKPLSCVRDSSTSECVDAQKGESTLKEKMSGAIDRIRASAAAMADPFPLRRWDLMGLAIVACTTFFLSFYSLGERVTSPPSLAAGHYDFDIEIPPERHIAFVYALGTRAQAPMQVTCTETSSIVSRDRSELPMRWTRIALESPCVGSLALSTTVETDNRLAGLRFVDSQDRPVLPTVTCSDERCVNQASSEKLNHILGGGTPRFFEDAAVDEWFNFDPGASRIKGLNFQGAYQTVHPWLGRALVYLSMKIQGITPFAWRFPSAFFGAMIPLALFFFARETLRVRGIAWLVCLLATFESGRLVSSRIALVDAQLTFALVMGYAFLVRYFRLSLSVQKSGATLLIAGFFIGGAISTKWIGLFGAPIIAFGAVIAIMMSYQKNLLSAAKTAGWWGICFGIVPASIYLIAYMPFADESMVDMLKSTFGHQTTMLSKHLGSQTKNAHFFTSRVPQWLFSETFFPFHRLTLSQGGGGVYLTSHPLLSWAILPSVVFAFWKSNLRNSFGIKVVLLFLAAHLIPWLFIGRTTFAYHFVPASMIGSVLVAAVAMELRKERRYAVNTYVLAYLVLFFIYLPFVYEVPLKMSAVVKYRVFDSWLFF